MIPFAGYRFLLGPEQLSLSPGRRVSSVVEYLAWHVSVVTRRGGEPWDSNESVKAHVNHGRWIADCFWCGTGMLTRPEIGVAYCGECGARYHKGQGVIVMSVSLVGFVKYPAEYRAIEKILLKRVRRDQQNWDDRQSVGDLERENQLPEVITP